MNRHLRIKTKQRGAVLLVSLLLLLVTTFVGFSAMETSNLEAKMATSRELKELTFQAAETVIERTLLNQALIRSTYTVGLSGGTWPTHSESFSHDTDLTGDVEVRYAGLAASEGDSIVEGSGGFRKFNYEIEATAGRANTNITSTHTQGIRYTQAAL